MALIDYTKIHFDVNWTYAICFKFVSTVMLSSIIYRFPQHGCARFKKTLTAHKKGDRVPKLEEFKEFVRQIAEGTHKVKD